MTVFIFKLRLVISLIGFSCLFGCSLILKNNYGYNDPAKFNEIEYKKFISSIDTTQFTLLRSSIGQFKQVINLGKDSLRKKDLNQPIQLLFFEGSSLVSYHANCYAKGTLSGVDWNYEQRFNFFPPKSAIDSSLFELNLSHFSKIYEEIIPQKRFTVLVFWSWMLEGVSRDALLTLQKNIKDNKVESEVEIYLINLDEFWSNR
jgi:hypothetical protein